MMIELELETEDGTVTIDEAALASITDAEFRLFRISRQELHRVFLEGVELMRSVQPGARVRPRAFETLDGRWLVHLVPYSALSWNA
jgi:hypothetical protein